MQKIPTLFVRDEENRRYVTDEVTPGCEWVLAGEGVARRKYDGTCVMRDENYRWWARREVKPGKPTPENFVEVGFDEITGKRMGWIPIENSSWLKFFLEALDTAWYNVLDLEAGTYELCGPKINNNPEKLERHTLFSHVLAPVVLGTKNIKARISELDFEGVVWHHPDGRMAKLKVRDIKKES